MAKEEFIEDFHEFMQSLANEKPEKKSLWELTGILNVLVEYELTPKEGSLALGLFFGGNVPENSDLVVNAAKWHDIMMSWEFNDVDWKDVTVLNMMVKEYAGPEEMAKFEEEIEYAEHMEREEKATNKTILDKYVIKSIRGIINIVRFESHDEIYTAITNGRRMMILDERDNDVSEKFDHESLTSVLFTGQREVLSQKTAKSRLTPKAYEIAFGDNEDITPFDLP